MNEMTLGAFDSMSAPPYPLSFRIALLFTVVFVFVAVPLARRNHAPLLVLTMPFWWSLAAAFVGLANVAAAQSFSSGGQHASAAGVAEAQIPLKWGLLAVSALCLLYAWRLPRVGSPQQRQSYAAIPLSIITLLLLAADCWLSSQLLGSNAVHARWKISTAATFAGVAGLFLVANVALVVIGSRMPPTNVSRALTYVFAMFAFTAALVVHYVVINLQEFAMRR